MSVEIMSIDSGVWLPVLLIVAHILVMMARVLLGLMLYSMAKLGGPIVSRLLILIALIQGAAVFQQVFDIVSELTVWQWPYVIVLLLTSVFIFYVVGYLWHFRPPLAIEGTNHGD